eukprot:TRINITY_DN14989_c0_g1_i1.p1 TRINITY_DN14989_c0_g1~~TRINITY_DN14989_c0_g1_i1.p1  ORF type:complete len:185 (-),score=25.52 TRINITY_DN14989_c0_g1_i1:288-842(-)
MNRRVSSSLFIFFCLCIICEGAIIYDGIRFDDFNKIVTTGELKYRDIFMKIPNRYILGIDNIEEGEDMFDKFLELSKEDEFWKDVFNFQDRIRESLPLFYTDEELEKLKNTWLYDMVNEMKKDYLIEFESLTEPTVSLESYMGIKNILNACTYNLRIGNNFKKVFIPHYCFIEFDPSKKNRIQL